MLNSIRNFQIIFLSNCHFAFSKPWMRVPVAPNSPEHLVVVDIYFLKFSHSHLFVMLSHDGFNLQLPTSNGVDHLFLCLFVIVVWSLVNYLFKSFLNELLCCLTLLTTFWDSSLECWFWTVWLWCSMEFFSLCQFCLWLAEFLGS